MARKEELDGSYVINIDKLLISPKKNQNYPSLIHKIKSCIHGEDEKDYEPISLSIGPYHHEKLATRAMQVMKYECLNYILKLNPEQKLEDYIETIKGMEKEIRNCYGDEIEMDRKNLLKIMLVDGCFIILTLLGVNRLSTIQVPENTSNKGIEMKINEQNGETLIDMDAFEIHENEQNIQPEIENDVDKDDSYHIRMWYTDFLLTDLLLLENQIPYFVITKIYEIAMGGYHNASSLTEGIAEFIESMLECYPTSITTSNQRKNAHHLFNMCHMYFRPSKANYERYESLNLEVGRWYQATDYRKSGIQFKKKELSSDNPHSLLDIEFHDGIMEIPCLNINHNTRRLFRNLIAFEQTCPQFGNYVTAYVVFWSQFVKTPDDVVLLTKKGIIVHHLNSEYEVLDLFAKLREGVTFVGDCYLNCTYYKMEAHYQTNKPRLMTWLVSMVSNFQHWVMPSIRAS